MTDHLDPYPREQIDRWPLHDARQELLEEIVSKPGAGNAALSTRLLVPIGIVAAIALIVGGAWFGVSGDDDSSDEQTVAATSNDPTAVDATSASTTEPTDEPVEKTRRRERREEIRAREVRIGKVRLLGDCARELTLRDLRRLRVQAQDVERARRHLDRRRGKHDAFVVDTKDCVVAFREVPRPLKKR